MIKYILGFVIVLTVILVSITIGANNDQLITFNYVIAQSELRLSTLVAILFGFGLILGWLITGIFYLKVKLQNMALNRRVKRQSQQITELTSPKAE
ncbi:LapA family protein [Haemophilus parahaemolyticus]